MAKRTNRTPVAVLRERLAQESARLMMEHGIEDFGQAKRKAAQRLSISAIGALPSNAQIEACLAERQRIFEGAEQPARIDRLRRIAAELMQSFTPFQPRLVGGVLSGTATINTPIELHLFSDAPEFVVAELDNRGIAFRDTERRFRYGGGHNERVPGYKFLYEGERVLVVVFPEKGLREAPLSPVDQRPMARAAAPRLLALLEG